MNMINSSVNASSSFFLQNQTLTYLSPNSFTSISTTHFTRICPSYIQISRKLHFPNLPRALYSPVICCHSSQTDFPKLLLKKIASLVAGSVLLMGCLSRRTVMALPDQKRNVSENLEEIVDDVGIIWERFLEKNPKDIAALKIVLYEKMRGMIVIYEKIVLYSLTISSAADLISYLASLARPYNV